MPRHGINTRSVCFGIALALACLPVSAATHTLSANASTAVAIDSTLMVVGDDEDQNLRIYYRNVNGPPLRQPNFNPNLGLTDFSPAGQPREVDIEASTRVGNRIYWLGSHGNCGGCDPPGEVRPNRNRLFATDITGTGTNTSLVYVGRYDKLKIDLLNWDRTNGHRLGSNYLQLVASATEGVPPETVSNDGFNIEGLTMAPTGTVAFIGFRSPLTPGSGRSNALVVPLLNLPQLVTQNPSAGPARFGPPIELFLDGRGVRSMDSASNGVVIIAGKTTNGGPYRIYTWSGNGGDPAVERQVAFTVNQPEGLILNGPVGLGSQIQLVSEGSTDFKSENVFIGSAIPDLRYGQMVQGAFRFLVLGRPSTAYDIEYSRLGGAWSHASRINVPSSGQVYWTNFGLPQGGGDIYRLRYPPR